MPRRKTNPLSRQECARRAGLATAKSPNAWSPFRHMDEDWKEANGRKGALAGMAKHPEHLKTIAPLGGKAPKKKRRPTWRDIHG